MNNNRTLGIVVFTLIVVTVLLSNTARAGTLTHHLAFQSFSYHFAKANERNGNHPGLGYEYSPTKGVGVQAGTFVDSFGYQAFYGGLNYTPAEFSIFGKPSRLMLVGNAMHKIYTKGGEPETRFVPMPILETDLYSRLKVNLTGTPQMDYFDGKHTNGVVFVQFKLAL